MHYVEKAAVGYSHVTWVQHAIEPDVEPGEKCREKADDRRCN